MLRGADENPVSRKREAAADSLKVVSGDLLEFTTGTQYERRAARVADKEKPASKAEACIDTTAINVKALTINAPARLGIGDVQNAAFRDSVKQSIVTNGGR